MLSFDHLAAKKSPFSGTVLIPAQLHNERQTDGFQLQSWGNRTLLFVKVNEAVLLARILMEFFWYNF